MGDSRHKRPLEGGTPAAAAAAVMKHECPNKGQEGLRFFCLL